MTKETTKEDIVSLTKEWNDQQVTELVAALLDNHSLVLTPNIVINVRKNNKSFDEYVNGEDQKAESKE